MKKPSYSVTVLSAALVTLSQLLTCGIVGQIAILIGVDVDLVGFVVENDESARPALVIAEMHLAVERRAFVCRLFRDARRFVSAERQRMRNRLHVIASEKIAGHELWVHRERGLGNRLAGWNSGGAIVSRTVHRQHGHLCQRRRCGTQKANGEETKCEIFIGFPGFEVDV